MEESIQCAPLFLLSRYLAGIQFQPKDFSFSQIP